MEPSLCHIYSLQAMKGVAYEDAGHDRVLFEYSRQTKVLGHVHMLAATITYSTAT